MLLKSKNIAYLGVLLALNQVFIILSSIIETNTLILFSVAALMVGIVIVEFGTKSGVTFYLASCILGYFLTFNKIEIFTYILFFGMYSIVKCVIEKNTVNMKFGTVCEFAIKIVYFNVVAICLYFLLREFAIIKLYWWLIVIAEIAFIVYDYAFSVFINYYFAKIKPKIKMK